MAARLFGQRQQRQSRRLHRHQDEREGARGHPSSSPPPISRPIGAGGGEHGERERRRRRAVARAGEAVEVGDGADLGAEQEQVGGRDGVEVARCAGPRGRTWTAAAARSATSARLRPSGSRPIACGLGRSTSSVTGTMPSKQRERHPGRGAGEADGARSPAPPPAPRRCRRTTGPVEPIEKASERRTLNQRAITRGHRHQAAGAVAEPEHDMEGKELPESRAAGRPRPAPARRRWRRRR